MKNNKSTSDTEQIEQLKAENRLKTKWLSLISHDCRGLFSNIKLLLDAMSEENITPELFMSMLPELKQLAQKNSKTLESTLAWVNAQADGFTLEMKPILIHKLFLNLVGELEEEIAKKELSFKLIVDEELSFNSDPFLLRFVLKQLIENAIKYSNKGGVVDLTAHSNTGEINLMVKDSGVGMNSNRLSTIGTLDGTPYTGTMQENGAGLSLAVVKDFVEMLNGTMSVSSFEEEGTSVEISIKISNLSVV